MTIPNAPSLPASRLDATVRYARSSTRPSFTRTRQAAQHRHASRCTVGEQSKRPKERRPRKEFGLQSVKLTCGAGYTRLAAGYRVFGTSPASPVPETRNYEMIAPPRPIGNPCNERKGKGSTSQSRLCGPRHHTRARRTENLWVPKDATNGFTALGRGKDRAEDSMRNDKNPERNLAEAVRRST